VNLSQFDDLDMVLVCGLPGAGKSHFCVRHFKQSGRLRINRKEIRRLLYEMTHFGEKWSEEYFESHDEFLVKHVEKKIAEHLLQNKQKVLVDNTSVSRESRKAYLATARALNKSAGAIFLDVSREKCMERNRSREDSIPDTVITNLSLTTELPEKHEGFQAILVVEDY
jgi:predicted kinase